MRSSSIKVAFVPSVKENRNRVRPFIWIMNTTVVLLVPYVGSFVLTTTLG